MKLSIVEYKGVKGYCRDGTSDDFIMREVIQGNAYRKLQIQPEDIILDIGLNIGMFSIYAVQRGAKKVIGYEPDADNFKLANENIELNNCSDKVETYNKAATGTDETERTFSINVKKNKAAHSLVEKRGRDSCTVQAENIVNIIEREKPTMIKMDIEGGEIECIRAINDYIGIREFIFEFHHAHLNESDPAKPRPLFDEVLKKMKENFTIVEHSKEPKGAWVTLVYCVK